MYLVQTHVKPIARFPIVTFGCCIHIVLQVRAMRHAGENNAVEQSFMLGRTLTV